MLTLKTQDRYKAVKVCGEWAIIGKWGQIALYCDGSLDVWVKTPRRANKMALIWSARSTYDDGACFIRPFSDLAVACSTIKARKKRHLSPETREKLVTRLAQMRQDKKKTAVVSGLTKENPKIGVVSIPGGSSNESA